MPSSTSIWGSTPIMCLLVVVLVHIRWPKDPGLWRPACYHVVAVETYWGSQLFCTLSPVCKANAAFQSETLRLWQVKYASSQEIWSGQQHFGGTAATSGACHRPCVENRERATLITGTYHLAFWHPSSRLWWRNNEGGVTTTAES